MTIIKTAATLNPNMHSVLSSLEVFKTAYVATLTGTSVANITVGTTTYKIGGTGFALTNGKLSAGTIDSIEIRVGGSGQFMLTELGLTVATLNAAAAAESTNGSALESILANDSLTLYGTSPSTLGTGNNVATPGSVLMTGKNYWYFGGGTDSATGGSGVDFMYGGDANDSLSGALGNDRVRGDSGTDTLNGAEGDDFLYGGLGTDTLNGGTGKDTLYSGTEDTLANTLNGDGGSDTLSDNGGAGVLNGGTDGDTLFGKAGADRLNGDSGADTLTGGTGADTLTGGAGMDKLTGGFDGDVFVFSATSHLGATSATADAIADFATGVDDISLVGLGLTFIGTRTFTSANLTPEVRWNASNETLQLDTNGDNATDFLIRLQDGATVVTGDILV